MLRALMPFGRPAAEIAHDARLLLRNQMLPMDSVRRHPVAWSLSACLVLAL